MSVNFNSIKMEIIVYTMHCITLLSVNKQIGCQTIASAIVCTRLEMWWILKQTGSRFWSFRSTQYSIPPGSLNRVRASAGGKGGFLTSAGWQVTLCDPV